MGNHLVAFALVAEEFEKTGDPIKGLKPLFAPLLSGKAGEEFNSDSFATDFSSRYGLHMTPFVGRALAERLTEVGLLVRIYDPGKGERFHVASFEWEPEVIHEHQIEQVIALFVAWGKKQSTLTDYGFTDEQLENAILSRLSKPEFASIFTRAAEEKSSRLKGIMGLAALDVSAKADAYLDYLVAQFIYDAAIKAPEVFGAISQISYGSLIADAVAGLAVPLSSSDVHETDLCIVLDGPLVLDLLDLNSREHRHYAEGLLDIVKSAGIRVALFEHSLEEMKKTIDATLLYDARGDGFGPMAHRFRTEQGQRAYAALVRDSLRTKVENLGIKLLAAEHYRSENYLKFFSNDRLHEVRNSIGDLHENLDARARDAESIAAVARLKGSRANAESLFDAGTIFVTRNSVLCKRVLRTLSRGYSEPKPRFTVATDGQLAGILWFVKGIQGLALSRKRLVANCSAAILPRREVVTRIASFLENVSPELKENFEAMMADSRASLCTMRLTGGDSEVVDESSSLKIVEAMRQELAAPAYEIAQKAESQALEARREAAHVASEAKEVVAILQGNIEFLEGAVILKTTEFDLKVAQFQLELDSASERARQSEGREVSRREGIRGRILASEERLERKVNIIFRILEIGLAILPVATAFTALSDNLTSDPRVKALSIVVAILAVGFVDTFLKKQAKAAIRSCMRSDVKFIEGLRAALDQLD